MRSPIAADSPTRSRIPATRRSISPRENVPWASSGRATMSLMRRRGLSEANGSWNTGWISRARALRSRSNRRLPSTSTVPAVGLSNPRIIRASVDLPQPDSPTTPSTLPAGTLKETSSTATTRFSADIKPVWTRNSHRRFSTSIAAVMRLQLRPVRLEPAKIVVRVARRPPRNRARACLVGMGAARAKGTAGKARADRRHHAGNRAERLVTLHAARHRHAGQQAARIGVLRRAEQFRGRARARPPRRRT